MDGDVAGAGPPALSSSPRSSEVDRHDPVDPHTDLLGIVRRGTVICLVLFALLRVTRRRSGGMGLSDVSVIVLIADALKNGMSGVSRSIAEGLALASTIVSSLLVERSPVRFPARGPRLAAAPVPSCARARSTGAPRVANR